MEALDYSLRNPSDMKELIFSRRDRFKNFQGASYRPGQDEAIRFALQSKKKVVAVSAPTGSGKSLIGMNTGAAYPRTCYLCSSKHLQRQLMEDFPEARYMMGRGNFRCNQDPEHRSADLCIHTRSTPCSLRPQCDYENHKESVLLHPLQILNYPYFIHEANYVGRFTGYPFIVCDEADVLEGVLTGFIELRLSRARLDTLNLSPPAHRTSTAKKGLESWGRWAETEAKAKVQARMRDLEFHVSRLNPDDGFSGEDYEAVREYKALEGLNKKLEIFGRHMDESWIFQEQKVDGKVTGWVFQPTWLTPELSREYFFRHGERFLLMSATMPPRPVLAQMLGLNTEEIDHIEIPSTFPATNRPVLLKPVADLRYETFEDELPKLLREIEQIIDRHKNERGLIHTTSWRLNRAVMGLNNPRLITHTPFNKEEALEAFTRSNNGVFVSPSSIRGLDLPDDLCRFIIIAKAPFQSMGDKLVSARVYGSSLGKFWYRAICAQDIVQASGRGVRHMEDYCITYLLDRQIEKLVVDSQNLFPRYWIEAVDYL